MNRTEKLLQLARQIAETEAELEVLRDEFESLAGSRRRSSTRKSPKPKEGSIARQVMDVLKKAGKEMTFLDIVKETGIQANSVSAALSVLAKKRRVLRPARGIYACKKPPTKTAAAKA